MAAGSEAPRPRWLVVPRSFPRMLGPRLRAGPVFQLTTCNGRGLGGTAAAMACCAVAASNEAAPVRDGAIAWKDKTSRTEVRHPLMGTGRA